MLPQETKRRLITSDDVRPIHYLNMFYCYVRSLFPPKNNQLKVVIYAQGRSGSTLLENLICSSGYFKERGEIISHYQKILRFPVAFVRGFSRHFAHENFIFHVKVYHLQDGDFSMMDPKKFLNKLQAEGWKIIFLHRENVLRQTLSRHKADKSKVYHIKKELGDEKKIELNLNDFAWEIERRKSLYQEEKAHLEGLDYIQVNYESDLSNADKQQQTLDRIFDYLGLPKTNVTTALKKTGKASLQDSISNYDEMLELVQAKGWAHYLN